MKGPLLRYFFRGCFSNGLGEGSFIRVFFQVGEVKGPLLGYLC